MGLESTMICLDNSEWMRNGDYTPSRLGAQQDAANALVNDRCNSNAENTVGVLAMAGNSVDMLVSPTEEVSKILAAFAKVGIYGKLDLTSSVKIAQLALKHRKNKNGGQRVIIFIGSPVVETVAELVKVGKQLKKNQVAIDVVSLGELPDNNTKLEEFVKACNSNDNSHFLVVAPGVSPVDALLSSPLVHLGHTGGGGASGYDVGSSGAGAAGGDDFGDFGGFDPSLDPEMAMALRASLEDSRAMEESRLQAATSASTADAPATSGDMDEEEAMAMAMSLELLNAPTGTGADSTTETAAPVTPAPATAGAAEDEEEEEEFDEEMLAAIQMSLADSNPPPVAASDPAAATTTTAPAPPATDDTIDADFMNQLLGSVDADINDPLIQAALAQLQGDKEKPEEKKKEDEK